MGVVYTGGTTFLFVMEIDLSETTKSHIINTTLKLTNHKCHMAK